MSNDKPGRAVLCRAALLSLLVCAVACGDDDATTNDGGSSDEDSGHHESPPLHDSGEPDSSEPDPMDAGRDATAPLPDGSEPDPDSGSDAEVVGPEAGTPLSLGGLTVSTTSDELEQQLDLFGAPGHRFWLEIDQAQIQSLNADRPSNAGCGEIYCPNEIAESGEAKYADHVLVEDVETQAVADYGKVEIRLVGETSFHELTELTIPNVRIDTDEFEAGKRIGTFEHFRLNNGVIGSIFRENIAHRIYRALGYPAARSSFALVGNSVWGDDVWTPMVLMEMYKRRFCTDHQELVGGTCENMWEFSGDIGYGYNPDAPQGDVAPPTVPTGWCQVSECDDSRLAGLMMVLNQTVRGPGFKAALADYVDWDRFHQFQCLSWIMAVGDDAIHASNNNLMIERDDGKFVWAPYSVDISAGHRWHRDVRLTGESAMALGCQADQACWDDTIAICEDLIADFDALNPEQLVDETFDLLSELDMLRYGDDDHAEQLRKWLVDRQANLAEDLERYRVLPDQYGNCPNDLERCADGTCGTAEQCMGRCNDEQTWCEAYSSCRYLWEPCPECSDALPYYCGWTSSCVADQPACQALCDGAPGYAWCEVYGACVGEDECPSDDDGGVPMSGGAGGIGGGGIGGFGGIMPPPFPID